MASTALPIEYLPCVERNDAPTPTVLAAAPFAYVGAGLSLDAFRLYVQEYDFGSIFPDQLIIHNTANPDASWAPLNNDPRIKWDRNEAGLTAPQIYDKRRKQLDGARDYYISLGWTAGPHLWIDDRAIWLFTPMNTVGVHAKEGNSYHDAAGRLHYTIGIEVVGWYGNVGWPASIQTLLRGAVQMLRDVLGTFQIVYRTAPLHSPARHQGSIAFHRDYNKPECPGGVITPAYAIPILIGDPLRARTLPGVPNTPDVFCSARAALFYAARGGLPFCGFPLRDEFHDASMGCDVLVCERVIIKESAQYGVEQALLSEALREGWLA